MAFLIIGLQQVALQSRCAIAASKYYGDAPADRSCDGKPKLPAEVDIKKGKIALNRIGSDQGFGQTLAYANDLMTQVYHHIRYR